MAQNQISQDERSSLLGQDQEDRDQAHGRRTSAINVEGLSTTRIIIAVGFTWFGSFLAALDQTITTTTSATIAAEFESLAIIAWLGSAYLISLALVQPLSGKLTDIFGRKPGLLLSAFLFGLGNIMCGTATTKIAMIFGRVVAGLGGGGLNAICTFVGNDLISRRSRGLAHGFGMVTYGMGLGLGGVVGGGLNDVWGWRWAFLFLVPLTVGCGIGFLVFVPGPVKQDDSIKERLGRVDFVGAALLTVALAMFLWSMNHERQDGTLSPELIAIAMPVTGVFILLFAFVEKFCAREPIIPLPLLATRNVLCSTLANFFNSMSLFGLLFFVPVYWQVKGFRTHIVGLCMLADPIGVAVGSLGCGLVTRIRGHYGAVKCMALVTMVGGSFGYSTLNLGSPSWLAELYLFMVGFGSAGTLTTLLLALLSAVETDMQAVATGVSYAGRTIGSTLGVTISGAVFRHTLSILADNKPNARDGKTPKHICHLGGDHGTECSSEQLEDYMAALRAVFLVSTGFSALGFVAGMATQNHSLTTTHRLKDEGESCQ